MDMQIDQERFLLDPSAKNRGIFFIGKMSLQYIQYIFKVFKLHGWKPAYSQYEHELGF